MLVATIAGILLGISWPDLGERMQPLGDGFIRLMKMIIAPIIFVTVVHGVAGMADMRRAGKVALKALIYFEIVTTLALVIGLIAVNWFRPGVGMNVDLRTIDASAISSYTQQVAHQNVAEFLLNVIPATFVGAFVSGNVLQVLLVSLLFAAALCMLGERGRLVLDFIDNLSHVFFRIVGYIMWAAPIGAFGAIAFTVGKFGKSSLVQLGALIAEFYFVCLLFVFVVLGGIARWAGVNLFRLLYFIRDEVVIVAATTSTESVLPRVIQKMQRLGCEESVVGLVVPTGYSFNLDGTCLYLATVAVFLAQATNTPLDLPKQLTLLGVLLLSSKGAAGVAGAAFVVLTATLASASSIPVVSIALVLGIHRLLAEALTFVNLVGNCVATLVVSKWDGTLDVEVMAKEIGVRRKPPSLRGK